MKANSPICVNEKPLWMAVLSGRPESSTPHVPNSSCPTMTTAVRMATYHLYSHNTSRSISMPTETKKMAPKRSFTGLTNPSICSASTVSARMAPIMNAPRADEKPIALAMYTSPKQSPMLTMSSISSVRYFRIARRIVGMK